MLRLRLSIFQLPYMSMICNLCTLVLSIASLSDPPVTNYLCLLLLEDSCIGGDLCSVVFVRAYDQCRFLLCDRLSVLVCTEYCVVPFLISLVASVFCLSNL
jgi:hypothetical protein